MSGGVVEWPSVDVLHRAPFSSAAVWCLSVRPDTLGFFLPLISRVQRRICPSTSPLPALELQSCVRHLLQTCCKCCSFLRCASLLATQNVLFCHCIMPYRTLAMVRSSIRVQNTRHLLHAVLSELSPEVCLNCFEAGDLVRLLASSLRNEATDAHAHACTTRTDGR